MFFNIIKNDSLNFNNGKWVYFIYTTFCFLLLFSIPTSVVIIFFSFPFNVFVKNLLSIFYFPFIISLVNLILSPFRMGMKKAYYDNIEGVFDFKSSIFYYFNSISKIKKIYKISFLKFVHIWGFPLAFLCLVRPFIYSVFYRLAILTDIMHATIMFWELIIYSVIIFFLLNYFSKYFVFNYLYIKNESLSFYDYLNMSEMYTFGKFRDYLGFIKHFTFDFVLCIFIVPLFFVMPNFNSASALYSKILFENSNINDNC